MHAFLQDFRYALRTLKGSLGTTLVIVASLAIGIGANTAIFSVVNGLLLKPLPYPSPDRLAVLWLRSPGINIPQDWPSPGQYIDVKNENRSFELMSISQGRGGTLLGMERPERVEALRTSSSLFTLLGAQPLHGRLLLTEDDEPGKTPVVILSHGFWTRMFGGDPAVVGRSLTLNGIIAGGGEQKNQFTVVGVLGPDFMLNDEVMPTVASIRKMDVFLPLPLGADAVKQRGDENYNIMARLKPGVTMAQADDDVSAIAGRIREKDQRDRTFTIDVVSLQEQVVGNVKRPVLVLLGSVALVLLIACANVANLLLTRASGRQKEVAIRTALGAGWQRLLRQLLTESVVLGVLGGAVGLLIARAGLYVVRTVNPGNIPRLDAITIDGPVLSFTLGVSVLTGIVFGVAPAWRAVAHRPQLGAEGGRPQHPGRGRFRVVAAAPAQPAGGVGDRPVADAADRRGPAGAQLRAAAERVARLQSRPGDLDAARAERPAVREPRRGAGGVPAVQRSDRQRSGRQGARRGVVAAVHVGGGLGLDQRRRVHAAAGAGTAGRSTRRHAELLPDDGDSADQGAVLRGRRLVDHGAAGRDRRREVRAALLAERGSDRQAPVERPEAADDDRRRRRHGEAVRPRYRRPDRGVPPSIGLLQYQVARTASDPAAAASAIIREIHAIDPTIPVYDVRTMPDRMSDSLARQRFSTLMLGAFAVFAVILAAVGVYGVMSYLVTQGTHDIGVRMALGASRASIVGMVVRHGLELTVAGIVIGLFGALALTRVMATLLFGITATDAVTFATVPVLLGTIAVLASYLPALRATRVDPVVALRDE